MKMTTRTETIQAYLSANQTMDFNTLTDNMVADPVFGFKDRSEARDWARYVITQKKLPIEILKLPPKGGAAAPVKAKVQAAPLPVPYDGPKDLIEEALKRGVDPTMFSAIAEKNGGDKSKIWADLQLLPILEVPQPEEEALAKSDAYKALSPEEQKKADKRAKDRARKAAARKAKQEALVD